MERAFVLTVVLGVAAGGAVAWADAPAGRYTVTADTVKDNRTGLTWQRAVPAQTYQHAAAVSYCQALMLATFDDWRLPTVSELLSIVDPTRASPAIDATAFPSTPSEAFWRQRAANLVWRRRPGSSCAVRHEQLELAASSARGTHSRGGNLLPQLPSAFVLGVGGPVLGSRCPT